MSSEINWATAVSSVAIGVVGTIGAAFASVRAARHTKSGNIEVANIEASTAELTTHSNEYIAIMEDVRENRKELLELRKRLDNKDLEVIAAHDAAALAMDEKRHAEGKAELQLNEIQSLKFRLNKFRHVIIALADRVRMSDEERKELSNELDMEMPPGITRYTVKQTDVAGVARVVEISTAINTISLEGEDGR